MTNNNSETTDLGIGDEVKYVKPLEDADKFFCAALEYLTEQPRKRPFRVKAVIPDTVSYKSNGLLIKIADGLYINSMFLKRTKSLEQQIEEETSF